ncbi:MAG TPA: geranylgeranyl reductase family protein [Solirubrobacteraceae bacterium]|nr:geranylgeranyl reductase family protein [Solirubrobacteraceae bacterium]
MEQFDAIVIGSGPAGSTAAFRLASEGARVLLLDKATFPRDKPCGGAISARAMRELPIDPGPVVEHVADRFELSFRGRRGFVRGGCAPLVYMTQRRRLDRFLAEQAVLAGADFRDGANVSEVSERGARVDGRWISSELLIGADGVNGPTARSLDLADTRVYGVALEGNLAYDFVDPERWRSTVVCELGTIPGGYCWIFPKGNHLNVGVGGWESTGPTLRTHLKELCERRGFDHSQLRGVRGYRLPGRRPGAALARGRALLIGDAAGLVDPLWGDGMYAAFVSSRLAAGAAFNLLAGGATNLEDYAQSLVSELGLMMGFALDAKIALDRFPRLVLGALISKPGWRMVENMLRGEIREPDAERGVAGIAARGFEAWRRHAGSPGALYRTEAAAKLELTEHDKQVLAALGDRCA